MRGKEEYLWQLVRECGTLHACEYKSLLNQRKFGDEEILVLYQTPDN